MAEDSPFAAELARRQATTTTPTGDSPFAAELARRASDAGDVGKFLPHTPEEQERFEKGSAYLGGVGAGVTSAYAGLVQTSLEGLAKIGVVTPELRDQFTSWASKSINKMSDVPEEYRGAENVGEVIGNVFSFGLAGGGLGKVASLVKGAGTLAGRLLTSTAIGAGAAATQFIPPEDTESSRAKLAATGAVSGALGGAVAEPLRAFGVKLANSQMVRQFVDHARRLAANFTENTQQIAQSYRSVLSQASTAKKLWSDRRDQLGAAVFASGPDTSKTITELNTLRGTTTDKAATSAIDSTISLLSGATAAAGRVGTVQIPLTSSQRAQIASRIGARVGYSTVSEAKTALDNAIENTDNEALKGARDEVAALKDKLEARTPELRKSSKSADKYTSEEADIKGVFDSKTLALSEGQQPGDMFAFNKKVLDLVTGPNAAKSAEFYSRLTSQGRNVVRRGIAFRALDNAIDKNTGVIDPKKVADFFRDKKGAKEFFRDREGKELVDGLTNLTTAGGQWAGAIARHGLGGSMMLWGAYRTFVKREPGEGVSEMVTGATALIIMNALTGTMKSQRGMNFIRAAGRLRPGSSDAARAWNSIISASGGLAGGTANPAESVTDSLVGQ